MIMNYDFRGDCYDTPPDRKKILGDYLLLNSRFFFFYRMIRLIASSNYVIRKKGRYSIEDWCESSYYALRSVEGCGGKIHVSGLSNIDKVQNPVVFVGNHMSTLETFLLPGLICPRKPSSFVVKKELVESFYFGPIMRGTLPIVVGRHNPMDDLRVILEEGVEKLKSGRSIIVFPQHTRSVQFKPKEFNSVGVKLAKKADVMVIPIAVKTDFWGNGKKIKDFGRVSRDKDVYIEFGEPMSVDGNGKETHNKIVEFIKSRLTKWGGSIAE
ncbi:MAG: lysophospholipid acyltransferase family protein [Lentisphaerota bacterium]